jgi:Arc/MetJ-type ribon-helix-helix transcriptional regulator
MNGNTTGSPSMAAAKIAISLDRDLLRSVDLWVAEGKFPNRSKAIQAAVREKYARWRRTRLAEECAKLDPAEEQAMADETFEGDLW